MCHTLVGYVDNERGYANVGEGDILETSVPSTQFFCES